MNKRLESNYNAYHQMALAQVPAAHIQMAFEEGDLLNVQDEVMKRYWAHVRDLLRKVPVFDRKIEFLSSFYERPPEEILDAIATAHFPRLTIAVTQISHNWLRSWINELYRCAHEQLEGAV